MSYLTEHSSLWPPLYPWFGDGYDVQSIECYCLPWNTQGEMAQASGITNIVRQVGGSFGVAMLTTILTTRVIYHSQMFGRAMDPNSPTFHMVTRNLSHFIAGAMGSVTTVASQQSQYLLFSHLNRQAFIQGIDDDFLVSAILTAVSIIPVFFLRIKKKKAERPPGVIRK